MASKFKNLTLMFQKELGDKIILNTLKIMEGFQFYLLID